MHRQLKNEKRIVHQILVLLPEQPSAAGDSNVRLRDIDGQDAGGIQGRGERQKGERKKCGLRAILQNSDIGIWGMKGLSSKKTMSGQVVPA